MGQIEAIEATHANAPVMRFVVERNRDGRYSMTILCGEQIVESLLLDLQPMQSKTIAFMMD